MHKHGKWVYGHFKDCIVFDEIKRQQTTIPNPSIHTPEEMQEHQDQIDYVDMLQNMREIKYDRKFYKLLQKRFISKLGFNDCNDIR